MGTRRQLQNVTITLDQSTVEKARVRAAEMNQSLSRFVGELVRRHFSREDSYEVAMRAALAEKPIDLKGPGERYLTREEANDRHGLRRR